MAKGAPAVVLVHSKLPTFSTGAKGAPTGLTVVLVHSKLDELL